ncbi:protein virilizer-like [Photinus pyralis]|uniref:protein virilizer-like n=1 Tax=Photinus pyralis TaxID=7054 RepID=UPI0012675092|nr:protein virilizer-like [Photinus pyralis]
MLVHSEWPQSAKLNREYSNRQPCYYADHLSVAQEIRGNHTVRIKNESRGFHLNNLSYAGPIVMGVGGNKSVTEESFDNYIHEGVKGIIALLKEITKTKETPVEPILPPPQSLLLQFSARSIFTLTDVIDEQLTTNYWLSVPAYEPTTEVDNVTCDLGEVCRQHLPADINIIREVEKVCRIYSSNNNEQDDAKTKGAEEQKEKNKKSFVVPIARRGFPYRQVQVRADLFRSRPPNTSRPPSLHVDDFVALETCGAQPTGPTGYNKISRELLATSRVTRGTRGRSFVNAERSLQQRQMSWWSAGLNRRPY